jgi:hypothetical protein
MQVCKFGHDIHVIPGPVNYAIRFVLPLELGASIQYSVNLIFCFSGIKACHALLTSFLSLTFS